MAGKLKKHINSRLGFTLAEVLIAMMIVSFSILGVISLSADILRNIFVVDMEISANSLAKKYIEVVKNQRDSYLKSNPSYGYHDFSEKLPPGVYRIEYDNVKKTFRFFDISENILTPAEKQDLKTVEIALAEKWGGPLNRYGEIDDSAPIKYYLKIEISEGIGPFVKKTIYSDEDSSGDVSAGDTITLVFSDEMQQKNLNGTTDISSPVNDVAEIMSVDNAANIEIGDLLSIFDGTNFQENMLVTGINGNNLDVKRGYLGTATSSYDIGDVVYFSKLEKYFDIEGVGEFFGQGSISTWTSWSQSSEDWQDDDFDGLDNEDGIGISADGTLASDDDTDGLADEDPVNFRALEITLGKDVDLSLSDYINPNSGIKNINDEIDATGEKGIQLNASGIGYSLLKKIKATVVWSVGQSDFSLDIETSLADLTAR